MSTKDPVTLFNFKLSPGLLEEWRQYCSEKEISSSAGLRLAMKEVLNNKVNNLTK